jgi:hypothetical protein
MWPDRQPTESSIGLFHCVRSIRRLESAIVVCLVVVSVSGSLNARQRSSSPTPSSSITPLSKQSRIDVLRSLDGETAYSRVLFPKGKTGLKLEKGSISPSRAQVESLIATQGAAAKPGDLVHITEIVFRDQSVVFEINGGPVKSQKWYNRIEVGGSGAPTRPIKPSNSAASGQGSFLELIFDRSQPEMTVEKLKEMLEPVFDFKSKSASEAYIEMAPPKVKQALKDHIVLVGMDRDMVLAAKGIPRQRLQESENGVEYEEWIYGEPPKEVSFIRFFHDEVSRVETITVDGKKTIKTEKEIDIHSSGNGKNGDVSNSPARPNEGPR